MRIGIWDLGFFPNFVAKIEISMSILHNFVRNYPFSMICIALVWTLSLVPFFPETPLDDVEFIDKWTFDISVANWTVVPVTSGVNI